MVHPIILLAILLAGLLICFGSRRKALVAFLAAALLIPTDQVLLIGGLHFPMLRFLILFGAARMIYEKITAGARLLAAGWNKIDFAMIALTVFTALNGILLYQQQAAVVFQLGNLYSAFGAYFLLRFLIRDENDVKRAIRAMVYVCLAAAAIMTFENVTGKNPYYAYLGGAHASMYGSTMIREERFRATGCFGHPNLAGTFGGISLPLFVGLLWTEKKNRVMAVLGIAGTPVMAWASGSSTAMLGFAGALLALGLWPVRHWMRPLRWAIVFALVGLHIAMKAPVWHLISRIDPAGGSSSYHRYQLVNQCILHFKDWWLVGTKSYADWGWDMWDLSNQYVGTADTAGLIPLLAFLVMIVYAFKYIGTARKRATGNRKQELLIWALGASLFANVVAFFGIGYFDQTIVAWYTLMVMIPVVAHASWKAARDSAAQPALTTDVESNLPAEVVPVTKSAMWFEHLPASTRGTAL